MVQGPLTFGFASGALRLRTLPGFYSKSQSIADWDFFSL